MKKKGALALLLSLLMLCSTGFIGGFAASAATTPTYRSITTVYDWGPSVSKLIVNLGQTVTSDKVDKDTFTVNVAKTDTVTNAALTGGPCTVTNAYVSDVDGKALFSGSYVTLELQVGPNSADPAQGNSYALNYDYQPTAENSYNHWVDMAFTITQAKDIATGSSPITGLTINTRTAASKPQLDIFNIGSFTNSSDNITMKYASYSPTKDSGKNPLIIWLHGAGEGGSDGTLPIAGNKACNFASPEIQSYFGGAYVLAPQCPTFWAQSAQGPAYNYTRDSKYENALVALIKDYVAKNPDIDTSRIYLGGDSNGGYMTMVMIRDNPGYFAAAMPTCEALKDSLITDDDIKNIIKTPTWLVAAKTDPVVVPANYEVPTYNRMVNAGATNTHFSLFDKVVDTTGLYKDGKGNPYEYLGHFSWIYVYNNQCYDTVNGSTTSIMEWLAAQKLPAAAAPATTTPVNPKTGADTQPFALLLIAVILLPFAAFTLTKKLRSRVFTH